jgi:hypothetical protein
MKKCDKYKAHEYFLKKYEDKYTNRGNLMSFGYSTMPRIIRYSPDLSSDAKICYETLMDMILNTEETIPWLYYPSQKRIALLSGLRRQLVNKAMVQLKKANLVGSKRQGLGKQNIYCLLSPPDKFVDNAIKCRAILNLISRDEISWDDISDSMEIKNEEVLAKIGREKSMVTLDVRNNGHQEVFQENADQLNDDTTDSKNSEIHQEVFGKNGIKPNDDTADGDNSRILQEVFSKTASKAMPPLDLTAISEKQELTSGDVSSGDLYSELQEEESNSAYSVEMLKYVQNIVDWYNGQVAIHDNLVKTVQRPKVISTLSYNRYSIIRQWYENNISIDSVVSQITEEIEKHKDKEISGINYFKAVKDIPTPSGFPDMVEHSKKLQEKYRRD